MHLENECGSYCGGANKNASISENSQLQQEDLQRCSQVSRTAGKYVILLIGQTGVGKSLLGTKIAELLGAQKDYFKVGHDPKSCTQECSLYESEEFVIIDTPGMFDTTDNRDELHVKNMVTWIKEVTDHVNAIVFVFTGQMPRFDQSQKTILQLFMASVGYQAISNVGIIFTRLAQDEKNAKQTREKAKLISDEFKKMEIPGIPGELPYWFVDNNPEASNETVKDILGEKWSSTISDLEQKRDSTLTKLLNWTKGKQNYDTKYVNYGCFDYKAQLADTVEKLKQEYDEVIKAKDQTIAGLQVKNDEQRRILEEKYTDMSAQLSLQINDQKAQNEGLQKQLQNTKQQFDNTTQQLQKLNVEHVKTNNDLTHAREKITQCQQEINRLNGQLTSVQKEKQEINQQFYNLSIQHARDSTNLDNLREQSSTLRQQLESSQREANKYREQSENYRYEASYYERRLSNSKENISELIGRAAHIIWYKRYIDEEGTWWYSRRDGINKDIGQQLYDLFCRYDRNALKRYVPEQKT